jgi:hypothetical protein
MFILYACFLFLYSCNNNISHQTQSFSYNIPKEKNGKYVYMYRLISKKSCLLGLEDMTNGVDSMEIRIWILYRGEKHHLIKINNSKKSGWSGRLYQINGLFTNVKNDSLQLLAIKELKPVNGWKNFQKTIFEYDLHKIHINEQFGIDGVTYILEVATKGYYNFSSIMSPDFKNDTYIEKLISFFEKEFSFERIQK